MKQQQPAADRYSKTHPPAAVRECMRELRRIDPHLLAIFNAWWFEFKTEVSARGVRRHLLREDCEWVPKERRFNDRFNEMRQVAASFELR